MVDSEERLRCSLNAKSDHLVLWMLLERVQKRIEPLARLSKML